MKKSISDVTNSTSNRSSDRRTFLKTAGVAGLGGLAASTLPLSPVFAQAKKVVAIMPGVFIPDPARPIVEQLSGVTVENAPYVSPTDTLAKLMAPGGTKNYDMMVSLTQFVKGPALGEKDGDERLHALDMSKIPNAQNLMPLFKKDIVTRAGKTYMVPVVWGYDSVIYNADKIPTDDPLTQSWGVLFDDKYKGKVAWRDDAHGMIMAAALHRGHPDPVAMDASDLKDITAYLIDRKKNVRTMWTKFGEAVNLVSSGEVWAMYGWIAMRAVLQKQGLNVTNNWPTDGLLTWNQSGFVPKDSPNTANAEAVINAMLSKEYGQKLTEVTNYPSTSAEVAALFSTADKRKLGFDLVDRGVKLYGLNFPANIDKWVESWNIIKTA
ncbi:MAG: extracellular solute-binding protein [Alphaproteobacteria bacterium]|nr:extracellular solute-binding protein [Alphaproteobacteria bacterium]